MTEWFEKKAVIGIVKRLIELKEEFWNKGEDHERNTLDFLFLHGKSDGLAKALEVIDGFLNFEPEIHKLIDDSKK